MDFILSKGKDFKQEFNFKTADGKPVALPTGTFRLVLERGKFAREFKTDAGLSRLRNKITWTIDGNESKDYEYSTLYYTLYMNDTELARGILKVQ